MSTDSKAAVAALLAFELNNMRPFDTRAEDMVQTSLESAHALAVMLGTAFAECPETPNTNGSIINAALNGIARLTALAAFAVEAQ